eukprot:1161568-Pelagomonas_calceolata.AAC.5
MMSSSRILSMLPPAFSEKSSSGSAHQESAFKSLVAARKQRDVEPIAVALEKRGKAVHNRGLVGKKCATGITRGPVFILVRDHSFSLKSRAITYKRHNTSSLSNIYSNKAIRKGKARQFLQNGNYFAARALSSKSGRLTSTFLLTNALGSRKRLCTTCTRQSSSTAGCTCITLFGCAKSEKYSTGRTLSSASHLDVRDGVFQLGLHDILQRIYPPVCHLQQFLQETKTTTQNFILFAVLMKLFDTIAPVLPTHTVLTQFAPTSYANSVETEDGNGCHFQQLSPIGKDRRPVPSGPHRLLPASAQACRARAVYTVKKKANSQTPNCSRAAPQLLPAPTDTYKERMDNV